MNRYALLISINQLLISIPLLVIMSGHTGCRHARENSMRVNQHDRHIAVSVDDVNWLSFEAPALPGGIAPQISTEKVDATWTRVRIQWRLQTDLETDGVALPLEVHFDPDFWWAPHLAPEPGYVIAQHVFRSPALIAARGRDTLVVVPDLDICGQREDAPWYLDLDAPARRMWLGIAHTDIPEHVLFTKRPGLHLQAGLLELGFYVAAYRDTQPVPNPWGAVSRLLWNRYARPLLAEGEPTRVPMDTYVDHTYRWAFDTWEDAVWQEPEIDGRCVGAPAFIVNYTQSPNYTGEPEQREYLSLWNQAWFSSLRSGAGIYRYARRTGNADLMRRAQMIKEFALSAPQRDGIFPAQYRADREQVETSEGTAFRSKGWETGRWLNSDRCPIERDITPEWYHVNDASWTCLLMLRWYDELEPDARLLEYAKRYAETLLGLQSEDGFFPQYLHPETLKPAEVLRVSPESSMSVTFLLKLHALTGDLRYRDAALKAMDAVVRDIIPIGRWEDFETYWSCCPWGKEKYLGQKIPRNGMFKQCNFSMFWTAEALLEAYRATGEAAYLQWGRRTLDELAMTQQAWQPPFIFIPALGGFGVMNCDGEWNDSRQTLFAELFLEYYKITGEQELFERGIAALKAGFVMMYCPENSRQKVLWEKAWPFFGPEDYGFMMENYGHGGRVDREGEGIGPFTIFYWGNGAASEARNRMYDHFGDVYIDRPRRQTFGIDSIAVEPEDGGFRLVDRADAPRDVRVVFEDGSCRTVSLKGSTFVSETDHRTGP
jgi:hypothetical protein